MFASISRLKNCGAAEPIAPCPVLNISIYTIAHLQATHIRAARKSTDYFCAQNSPCLRGTAGQPHTPQNREYAKARITTSSVKAHPYRTEAGQFRAHNRNRPGLPLYYHNTHKQPTAKRPCTKA